MLILGIESSCDETSAAVVLAEDKNGRTAFSVKSNIIASQIAVHARYGGVVPEIASRAHSEAISEVTSRALSEAGVSASDIGLVAVTSDPGLIGSLLVGVNFAKALAYACSVPLVGVNHIKGHIAANYLQDPPPEPPFLAFVASGGHTSMLDVTSYTDMHTVGCTRDDAMGEAFDKTARILGIPYPGGAELDRLAYESDAPVPFPSAAIAGDTLDLSFSGMKTAVINHINTIKQRGETPDRAAIASGIVNGAVSSVIAKLKLAIEKTGRRSIVAAGGVAASRHLRTALEALCKKTGCSLFIPPIRFCGDNGAMIAAAGYFEYQNGNLSDIYLNACANGENEI